MAERAQTFQRLGALKGVAAFRAYLDDRRIDLPCDDAVVVGDASPLARPIEADGLHIGNRIAVHPMEGWDGTPDGRPTEATIRRWRRFGASGAKLIWGGEAVAVRRDGRANPNQLAIGEHSRQDLAALRAALLEGHVEATGSVDGLVIGLQLTHSGRYCVPEERGRREPRIVYRHPILDRRVGIDSDDAVIEDGEIRELIEAYHSAAKMAADVGFDFVDIKHCHGYLGHEFLSARTRPGPYGGSFENRTRFLREIVEGVRSLAPGLRIGVRLSAFDTIPFQPDPDQTLPGKPGPGVPEPYAHLLPYRWGFGVNAHAPEEIDLAEPLQLVELLERLNIGFVNVTGGNPYANPHVQRPAFYPPSDGYLPPEDPLVGVARLIQVARTLKQAFPRMLFVGTGYSYLQEFLPPIAQAAVAQGWVDCVGLGRVVLSYPEVLSDPVNGRVVRVKKICRTFSDCTTAPRNGLPSGCYPLDEYYKDSAPHEQLKRAKAHRREGPGYRMTIDTLIQRTKPRRRVEGIAAALLPFESDGRVAVDAFQRHLRATHAAGLTNAVNMDTGYANHLSDDDKRDALRWTREALGPGVPFVAGAYVEGRDGDLVSLYRRQMDEVVAAGGIPILFQTSRLHGRPGRETVETYRAVCRGYSHVIGFELGSMFAPNGTIWDEDTVRGLMDIPELKGMKHSSLDRGIEWTRLRLRDEHRPDFRIYTGNDLGINMIEYGSDYLLGLATFAPEKFAERDRLWAAGDPVYYELSDGLQHLGNVAFRAPVPAYKHSAAVFLNLLGRIPSPRTHPHSATRPAWEADLLQDCARRLKLLPVA